jgi:hypothetical protein
MCFDPHNRHVEIELLRVSTGPVDSSIAHCHKMNVDRRSQAALKVQCVGITGKRLAHDENRAGLRDNLEVRPQFMLYPVEVVFRSRCDMDLPFSFNRHPPLGYARPHLKAAVWRNRSLFKRVYLVYDLR